MIGRDRGLGKEEKGIDQNEVAEEEKRRGDG